MGAFICSKCGCVDNTATSNFWTTRKLLCTKCDPCEFPDMQKMNLEAFKREPPKDLEDFCFICGFDTHTCEGRHPYLKEPKP